MNEYISKINLDDLYEKENTIIKNREKIYNKILSRIHKKIKYTSRTNIKDKFCFFLIPEFIMGVPKYDVATCIAYVVEQLPTREPLIQIFAVMRKQPSSTFTFQGHH